MVYFVPFGRVQLAFETIEEHIEHFSLSLVQLQVFVFIPETYFPNGVFGLFFFLHISFFLFVFSVFSSATFKALRSV